MKKKILSLVLVVAMLASMLVFAPVSGATETAVTVSTTDAVGVVGQTVSVDVVLLSNTPLFGIQLGYEYDSTMLHLDSVTWGVAGGSGDYSNKLSAEFNCAQGPLDVMIQTYASTFDAAEGLVIATLNFTALKEGSSKVAIRDFNDTMGDSVNYAYTSQNYDVYFTGSEIACAEASNVTVYPAGYTPLVDNPAGYVINEEDGEIEVGVWGGTIVLPSDQELEIGQRYFASCDKNTTLIIPENISISGKEAFRRIEEGVTLTVIFLGNSDLHAQTFDNWDAYDGNLIVKSAAGGDIQSLAEAAGATWEAFADLSLTLDDESYLVPANTTVPDVVETNDGKLLVGWTDGENKYAPGAAITLTGATSLTSIKIDAIKMNTGVGFKMGAEIDKCQMRFTTDMTVADYNTLASLGTVTVGTLITPAAYVSKAGGLTFEALDALSAANGGVPTYINVPAGGYFKINQEETVYTFAGSLAGFKNENIDLPYAAAFYATVAIDEETSFTVYSAFDLGANRTVNSAITAMTGVSAAEYGLTITEANTLRDLIAAN